MPAKPVESKIAANTLFQEIAQRVRRRQVGWTELVIVNMPPPPSPESVTGQQNHARAEIQ